MDEKEQEFIKDLEERMERTRDEKEKKLFQILIACFKDTCDKYEDDRKA